MKKLLHKSPSNLGSGSSSTNLVLLRKFYRVASAFFFGDAKWKARGLFALMLVLCCTSTGTRAGSRADVGSCHSASLRIQSPPYRPAAGLLVVISYLQRDFSTAISKKNEAEFYRIVAKFLGIVCVAGPLLAVYDFVQVRATEAGLRRLG